MPFQTATFPLPGRGLARHYLLLAALLLLNAFVCATETTVSHAVAMHGQPKYGPDFERFDYTSAEASKGGAITLHELGTFDSLNGFIAKGTAAAATGQIYDTLTVSSADEPFTQYGLVAKAIEYPQDRSWVIFHLNKQARFHDGKALTAADVKYTFELLTTKGNPFYSFYYADVTSVEVLTPHKVRFNFREDSSHETLLIIGQLPVLPKHFWETREFEQSSLEIPLGSGPYKITAVDPGRSITLSRVKDYWGEDHPVRRGFNNFDQITYDYYRDDVVALEAFKAGEYDYRAERTSKLWATAYNSDALKDGRIKKIEIPHQNPTGMQAFIFNLRNPLFQDRTLRQAISLAFDFEWANKNLFYDAYTRTRSFFSNSDLASSGLPGAEELALLEPFRKQLPAEVFNQPFSLPSSNGSDHNRTNLRAAKRLLDEAGYRVVNGTLVTPGNKTPVEFELLLYDANFERIANPFVQGLKKLGIIVTIRIVDTSQFINRRRNFDFDMISHVIGQSLSPGNEQRDFWYSEAADMEGSRNLIGVKSPVVDALVDEIIQAKTRPQLIVACRALDRVLLHSHYVIPQWHINKHRIAYWDKFNKPAIDPPYDPTFDTGFFSWWLKPQWQSSSRPE
ncbi:ABC transporter substrate-binding protein [Pseudomaricurvus alcaniphilus]|uniref:extracellular solute-binding protein n=1 Tax=Pseudomaricurvus alcaniphilus TaxID=1166482 RepID=UPI00140DFD43|nr:extracellular solute-binding protein [Pseudomaricurvus alcaniphilus]NHN36017.1 ABC transporter substrate-binding protein [Pseudomaricurvus alcaniphilus]